METKFFVDAAIDLLLFGANIVIDASGLAGSEDLADDAGIFWNLNLATGNTGRGFADQLLAGAVGQENGG